MFDKMKQLMEVKRQADKIKRELDGMKVEVNDIEGIKLIVNGTQQVQSLEIDETLLTPQNKKKLESDLLRSLNLAMMKSQSLAADKMKNMAGLNIPGL